VAIDGTDVPAGQELEIDPGEHLVVARAPGMTPFEERFRVGPGSRHEVVATFEPQPPTPLAPPDARRQTNDADASAKSAGGPPIGPLVLGGVGVAATAVGVALRVTGQSDYDSASEQCPEAGCPNGELADNGNSARNRMLVGTVVAGVGAAALVGAGIWWVLTPSAKNDAAARPLRFRRVAVGVGGNDETTWVGLRGVF
jgi:hypothetical protein